MAVNLGETTLKVGEEAYFLKLNNGDLRRLEAMGEIKTLPFLLDLDRSNVSLKQIEAVLSRALMHHEPRLDKTDIADILEATSFLDKLEAVKSLMAGFLVDTKSTTSEAAPAALQNGDAPADPL